MTCKQKFCIFLPKKIVFSSTCFSFLLLWARRKKNYCPYSHLDLPLVRKISREEQIWIPKAGQPLQVRILVLTVSHRLRLLHCTGIKLYPKQGRWHPRKSISRQDYILVSAVPLPSLSWFAQLCALTDLHCVSWIHLDFPEFLPFFSELNKG